MCGAVMLAGEAPPGSLTAALNGRMGTTALFFQGSAEKLEVNPAVIEPRSLAPWSLPLNLPNDSNKWNQ